MKVESKLILTSKNLHTGVNLYTFVLVYPRCILAEVNTHRMLSRNTASSRAIPARKQRERVLTDPFVPLTIGQNKKGMQAGEELAGWRKFVALQTWKFARYPMVEASWILDKVGAHKQVVNRIVEPWTFTQQVVTCTDLKNVFKLRNHPDAEPHFHELARQMQEQVEYVNRLFKIHDLNARCRGGYENAPAYLNSGVKTGKLQVLRATGNEIGDMDWHLPFIDNEDVYKAVCIEREDRIAEENQRHGHIHNLKPVRGLYLMEILKKISTARCARVSYFLPESGERSDINRDIELCDRLSTSAHWSPFEHIATPMVLDEYSGNFRSWKQYRKEFEVEAGGDR